ncbi:MAG: hypothetical protein J07HQX50_01595 [Haloquadratum sp. J07HQX50]|nr:MAG: hypothetical protein J07HQX50_01595 [Haloquadratum sp. J07HQX50]
MEGVKNRTSDPKIRDTFIIDAACNYIGKMKRKTEQIGIESLVKKSFDKFMSVSEIHIAHLPFAPEVDQIHLTVHTGATIKSFEQSLELTSAHEALIDVGEAEPLALPFTVMATIDRSRHIQGIKGTTVYMADNRMRAESRELETGLSILRQKLAGVCPSCHDSVDSFSDHYEENQSCQEANRV